MPSYSNIDSFPEKIDTNTLNNVYCIIPVPQKNIYTNLTGGYPRQLSRGHNYIFILYNYDINAIMSKPLKDCQVESIIETWKAGHVRLTKNGHTTSNYVLDNECSVDLKAALLSEGVNFELVLSHQH